MLTEFNKNLIINIVGKNPEILYTALYYHLNTQSHEKIKVIKDLQTLKRLGLITLTDKTIIATSEISLTVKGFKLFKSLNEE